MAKVGDSSLVSFQKSDRPEGMDIIATIRAPRNLTYGEAVVIQRELASSLQVPVALKLLVVPVTKLDPLIPPTLTATLVPGVIATPTQVSTATPTMTKAPVPIATPTQQPSATATSTALPTHTALPTPTFTPVTVAAVGSTDQEGANLRRSPGLTALVESLPDGVLLQLTGRRADADSYTWVEVVMPDGRVGWLAADYLVPHQTYQAPGGN